LEKILKLEIITMDRVVYRGDVVSVSAPGSLGEFQVLFNHAPLVSRLEIGRIKIVDQQNMETRFSVSGGIFEVRDNKIIILADAIENQDEIDVERAQKAIEKAQAIIDSKSFTNKEEMFEAIRRAKNRIKISKI